MAPTVPVDPPQASSSSSSAAISASSTEVRRAASGQRQQAHRVAQRDLQAAAQTPAQAIEASIMGSFNFTEAELAYAADNFERSPVAALAFAVANTGIANTPEDLGTLLDGPPDPADSIAAFKRRTETPLHACACCGMRTYDCTRMLKPALDMHVMSAAEVLAFDALPEVLQQVKSTCTIEGRRYMLHPELVHASSGNASPDPGCHSGPSPSLRVLQMRSDAWRSCALIARPLLRMAPSTRCRSKVELISGA